MKKVCLLVFLMTSLFGFSQNDLIVMNNQLVKEYFTDYVAEAFERGQEVQDELLEKMNVVHFDESAAECFGEIKSLLKSQGKIICDSDLFIAAVAISNDLILVTNNKKHFERIDKLGIANWVH